MPFALIIFGILFIVVGIRNTQGQLGTLIQGDFTGSGNFFYWVASLFIIGALGYIEELEEPSRMLIALVLIAFIFANRGFFQSFVDQLKQGSAQAPPPGPPNPQAPSALGGSVGSGIGGAVGGGSGGSSNPLGSILGPVQSILGGIFGS